MSKPLHERSLAQLTLMRFREFYREPEAVFWVFVFPILLAAGLGIAFRNRAPEVLKVAAVSKPIVAALRTEKGLAVQETTQAEAEKELRTGKIVLLVRPGAEGKVVFQLDETIPDARIARLLADNAIQRAAGRRDPVAVSNRIVSEPGARYIDFLIPGLLAMNLLGNGVWGVCFGIVDARRKKLLKRLIASPMSRSEYLLSYLCSRLVLLVVEVGVIVGFAVVVFGVPVRAPMWQIGLLCLLGSFAFGSMGLLLASRAQTIEAVSGLANLVLLPMWVLSGVFFSAQNFPAFAQPVIKALPLTAAVDALRASMLEGAPITQMTGEVAILCGWLVVCFGLALKMFRWR